MGKMSWLLVTAAICGAAGLAVHGQQASHKANSVVVVGCVEHAGTEAYTVTDFRDRIRYTLTATPAVTAPAPSLERFRGREIEVHGTYRPGTPPSIAATSVTLLALDCRK